jgi:hypothetical protein
MKESGKRHGEACASRRLGNAFSWGPVAAFQGTAAARSQERATADLRPPNSYLTLALPAADFRAAAATDDGSANAITASPIRGLQNGLPPKALTTYSTPLTS